MLKIAPGGLMEYSETVGGSMCRAGSEASRHLVRKSENGPLLRVSMLMAVTCAMGVPSLT